jgi:hypothetical protein
MLAVPAPPVTVPFVIAQAYVAPAPAFGTEAVLPPEVAQTVADVAIAAEGIGLKTTVVDACALPPHGPGVLTVTVYVPPVVMPVGFCCGDVNPPGPVHEKIEPLPLAKRLTVVPAQAGPLFDAFAVGAGAGGQMTVVDAVPVMEAVTMSVAVIVCGPGESSVTLNVCEPLSPATKVYSAGRVPAEELVKWTVPL